MVNSILKMAKARSYFEPYHNVCKVYVHRSGNLLIGLFYGNRNFQLVDEGAFIFHDSVNIWLTENCTGAWGFYLENYAIDCYNEKVDLVIQGCKPFFGFEHKNDALLFKLAVL